MDVFQTVNHLLSSSFQNLDNNQVSNICLKVSFMANRQYGSFYLFVSLKSFANTKNN